MMWVSILFGGTACQMESSATPQANVLDTAVSNCTSLYDADGDGYFLHEDCDDTNPDVHPNAVEVCDGIDNDCDQHVDVEDADLDLSSMSLFFADMDGDGFGNPEATLRACSKPTNYVPDGSDCNDNDPMLLSQDL